jgi:hypothetical protein
MTCWTCGLENEGGSHNCVESLKNERQYLLAKVLALRTELERLSSVVGEVDFELINKVLEDNPL